jgi:hypothetical protein
MGAKFNIAMSFEFDVDLREDDDRGREILRKMTDEVVEQFGPQIAGHLSALTHAMRRTAIVDVSRAASTMTELARQKPKKRTSRPAR